MCHLGDPPPLPRGLWEQIVFIRSRNVVPHRELTPPPPPVPVHPGQSPLSVVLIQLFFFWGGGFSGSRRLPGYFVQTSMLDGLLAVPACRRAEAWVVIRAASSLNAPFLFLTRSSSPRPPTVLGYCDSGLFGISPCSVVLHR